MISFAGVGLWLAKIGIGSIVKKITAARIDLANANTEEKRIEARERINALEARRDVQIAEGDTPINAFIRAGFAIPPMVYFAKLYVWDKVLKLGTTDPLSDIMEWVAVTVIAFYFLAQITRQWKRRS